VLTSTPNQLHDSLHQWKSNGVGLMFNHLFGFGVLNAEKMVSCLQSLLLHSNNNLLQSSGSKFIKSINGLVS